MNNKYMRTTNKYGTRFDENSILSVDRLRNAHNSPNSFNFADAAGTHNVYTNSMNKRSNVRRIILSLRNNKSPASRSNGNCSKFDLNNDIRLISTSIFPLSRRNQKEIKGKLGYGIENKSKVNEISQELVDCEPKQDSSKITAFMKYLQSIHVIKIEQSSDQPENKVNGFSSENSEQSTNERRNIFNNLNFDNKTIQFNKSQFASPGKKVVLMKTQNDNFITKFQKSDAEIQNTVVDIKFDQDKKINLPKNGRLKRFLIDKTNEFIYWKCLSKKIYLHFYHFL